jgi:hypothetical protein
MGQLADQVRSELQHEFFKEHKLLFVRNTPEYCRQCKQYVEQHARGRLIEYKRKMGKDDKLESSDFL